MELVQVIIKPYLTEKTFTVRNASNKEVIAFEVNPKATKHDIKRAFEAMYEVKVESINTITRKPSLFRTGTRVPGRTKLMKIAYVTLPSGVKLAVTKEEVEVAQEEIKAASSNKKTSTSKKATKEVEVAQEEIKAASKSKKTSTSKKVAKEVEVKEVSK